MPDATNARPFESNSFNQFLVNQERQQAQEFFKKLGSFLVASTTRSSCEPKRNCHSPSQRRMALVVAEGNPDEPTNTDSRVHADDYRVMLGRNLLFFALFPRRAHRRPSGRADDFDDRG